MYLNWEKIFTREVDLILTLHPNQILYQASYLTYEQPRFHYAKRPEDSAMPYGSL
jgi:hypothetical protein